MGRRRSELTDLQTQRMMFAANHSIHEYNQKFPGDYNGYHSARGMAHRRGIPVREYPIKRGRPFREGAQTIRVQVPPNFKDYEIWQLHKGKWINITPQAVINASPQRGRPRKLRF
jgi:hypothetical protein